MTPNDQFWIKIYGFVMLAIGIVVGYIWGIA